MKNINKVIVKGKDEWSSFAEFIGNLVAKYADEMKKYHYSHIEIEFVI